MGDRTFGVASSKADIDEGTISGVSLTATNSTLTTPTISSATMTGTNRIQTLIVSAGAAFFSVTAAIAQPSGAAQAAVATTAATTGAATYGLTSAQANGVVTLLNQIRSDLVALGLIKGS